MRSNEVGYVTKDTFIQAANFLKIQGIPMTDIYKDCTDMFLNAVGFPADLYYGKTEAKVAELTAYEEYL